MLDIEAFNDCFCHILLELSSSSIASYLDRLFLPRLFQLIVR